MHKSHKSHKSHGRDKPALRVAVLNTKGGTGKSTVSRELAAAFFLRGMRTLLCSIDPQGTAYDWCRRRADDSPLRGLAAFHCPKPMTAAKYRELGDGYDVTILDGPASLHEITAAAAIAADVVVVPLIAGWDFWALNELGPTLKLADAMRAELGREPLAPSRVLFVLNKCRSTRLEMAAPRELETGSTEGETPLRFADIGTVAKTGIPLRASFAQAGASGGSVLLGTTDGAAEAIRSLCSTVVAATRGRSAARGAQR